MPQNKSPGIFAVAGREIVERFEWIRNHPLYRYYFILFLLLGTSGIWFKHAFIAGHRNWGAFFDSLNAINLLTFSAPIFATYIAKYVLLSTVTGEAKINIKTLRSFCFFYFLTVIIIFTIAFVKGIDGLNCWAITAVLMVLAFQFFRDSMDEDYEDNVDPQNASLSNKQAQLGLLKGNKYE